MSIVELLFATFFIVLFGSFIQGILGFGLGLVGIPLLLLFMPATLAVPALICVGTILNTYLVIVYWKYFNFKWVFPLAIASFIGIPLGKYILDISDPNIIKLVVGLIIAGVSILNLLGKKFHGSPSSPFRFLVPILSGFLATAIGIGGPPMALYFESFFDDPRRFKGSLTAYFLVSGFFILVYFYSSGTLTPSIFPLFKVGVAGMAVGATLGVWVARFIPKDVFHKMVLTFLVFLGFMMVATATIFKSTLLISG
jgi:hypothetical protein